MSTELEHNLERVAVDYFTVTATLSDGKVLWVPAGKIISSLNDVMQHKPWRFFGYTGFYFSHKNLGHFAYGESPYEEQGLIIQASGEFADRYISHFLTDNARYSRLDLSVDAKLEPPDPNVALAGYEWIVKNQIGDRKYSFVTNNLGGQTLYVGARSSDQFARLYDKASEVGKGEPGSLWRYEIELKGARAKTTVQQLKMLMPIRTRRIAAIATTVHDFFTKRDIRPIFSRLQGESLDLHLEAVTMDDQRRIVWLRKQVAPTVRDMLTQGNVEVLEALGVTDFFRVERK